MPSENFVIAGVSSDTATKGQVVEMSSMEKVKVAVGLAASDHDPDFSIWCSDLSYGPVRATQKGDLLNKRYQHNDYTAEGTGMFSYKRKTDAGQTIIGPRQRAFKITFSDALNRYGAPDLKVHSFELIPLS